MVHSGWRMPPRLSAGNTRPELWLTAGQSYQIGKLDFSAGKPLPYLYTIYQNMSHRLLWEWDVLLDCDILSLFFILVNYIPSCRGTARSTTILRTPLYSWVG